MKLPRFPQGSQLRRPAHGRGQALRRAADQDQASGHVSLRGAYDCRQHGRSISSDFYYQSRRRLAVARPNPADPNAALPLDRDWGLHPALKDVYPLYQRRAGGLHPFAG